MIVAYTRVSGASREDVLQEARIGFYKAIRDFNPGDGAPFVSFAVLAIQRQLITADGVMDVKLSDLEAEVLLYRLQGLMYQEIADKLNKPAKAVDNARQRLHGKLKRVLAERLTPLLAA